MSFTPSSIFPILGYVEKSKTYYTVGTAFFVNSSGIFITAAHTFNNDELKFFAIIDNYAWPITQFFKEYVEMLDQKAPQHLDLYIGQLETGSTHAYLSFKSSITLNVNDHLEFNGFASKQYHDPKTVVDESVVGEIIPDGKMSDQWPDVEASLTRLKQSFITGMFVEQAFEGIHEKFKIKGAMTNGFTFELTNSEIEPKGLSGCPAIHDKNVTGMLIAKNGAITSEYIISKLEELKLEFHLIK